MLNASKLVGGYIGLISNTSTQEDKKLEFVDFKGKITKIKDTNNSILSTSLSSEKLSSFRKNYPIWKDFDQFELKKI